MKPIDRRQAQQRMQAAKELFTRASIATLEGNPLAVSMANAAIAELNAAREELNALADEAETRPFPQDRLL